MVSFVAAEEVCLEACLLAPKMPLLARRAPTLAGARESHRDLRLSSAVFGGRAVEPSGSLCPLYTEMRRLLVQAAHSMMRSRETSHLQLWAAALADRRGKGKAIVALARRLAE